jgi:CHASE3 domain sensor protein
MRISHRLILGFSLILLIVLLMAIFTYSSTSEIDENFEEITTETVPEIVLLARIENQAAKLCGATR